MANEHPKSEEDVPQFSRKLSEKFADWVTDVRLWEAEHKDETKPRLGPNLYKRGLFGQPNQIINAKLREGELANFTAGNIIQTLEDDGYGDTPGEKGQ